MWAILITLCLVIILPPFALLLRESAIKAEEKRIRDYREKIRERKIKDKMCKPKGE